MEMVMMWRIVYRSISRLAYIQVGLMWANCLPIHYKADIYPSGIVVEKCRPIHYQACIYRSGIAVEKCRPINYQACIYRSGIAVENCLPIHYQAGISAQTVAQCPPHHYRAPKRGMCSTPAFELHFSRGHFKI